jgi:hypothetical protein
MARYGGRAILRFDDVPGGREMVAYFRGHYCVWQGPDYWCVSYAGPGTLGQLFRTLKEAMARVDELLKLEGDPEQRMNARLMAKHSCIAGFRGGGCGNNNIYMCFKESATEEERAAAERDWDEYLFPGKEV